MGGRGMIRPSQGIEERPHAVEQGDVPPYSEFGPRRHRPAAKNGRGEAAVALAFVAALLRALRDRGTLSRAEVDDVLNDVEDQVAGKASYLVENVRRDLERRDDE